MDQTPAAAHSGPETKPSPSERQTAGWDLRNAFRNYSTLVASQVAVAIFSFTSVWLITRNLGADGYGGVVAVLAASQIAQIFVNWTGISLVRFGVEEFVASGSISNSFWARTAILFPNTVVMLLTGFLWLPLLASALILPPDAIPLIALHFLATAFSIHINNSLQAAKLPRLQGVLLAAERLMIFAELCVLIGLGRLNWRTAVASYILAPVLTAIIGIVAVRGVFSWRITIRLESIKKLLRFSVPLIPYSLIGYFSTNYLDAIFISQYLDRADLGVYSVAYQINGVLMQFPLLASTLLMPLFVSLRAGGKEDRVTTYMEDLVPLLTFIGGLGGIFAAMALKFIIPLFFGAQVQGSVIIFWILISSAVFAIPTIIGFSPYTNAISATYVASLLAVISSVVNLAANYFLIPIYGLKGCAWATVLAYGTSVLVVIVLGRIKFSLRHRWTIPALIPTLAGSVYASVTGDLNLAFALAMAVSFVIVLIWRKAVADGFRVLRYYREFAAG